MTFAVGYNVIFDNLISAHPFHLHTGEHTVNFKTSVALRNIDGITGKSLFGYFPELTQLFSDCGNDLLLNLL